MKPLAGEIPLTSVGNFPFARMLLCFINKILSSGQLHWFNITRGSSVPIRGQEASGRAVQACRTSHSWTFWARPCLRGWWLSYAKEVESWWCLEIVQHPIHDLPFLRRKNDLIISFRNVNVTVFFPFILPGCWLELSFYVVVLNRWNVVDIFVFILEFNFVLII